MRIAIDLLLSEKLPGGLLFATCALLEGLARIDQINEYIIITGCPKEYQALAARPNMSIYPVKLRSWRGLLIQHQLLVPNILRQLQPDLLHVPAFAAPIGWSGPLVVTVNDLSFLKVPEQASLYGRLYWTYLLHESVRRAQRIIAVSEQTHEELTSIWQVEAERICLVHHALRPSLRYTDISVEEVHAVQQRYGKHYLLHVGRIMPRKNLGMLIEAFNLLALRFDDVHLVMTGGAGYGSEEVLRQIEVSPYRERIHLVGWVSDQDLGALYAGASTLVFPSKHEGFGLPTLEAMACGTPVVASYEAANQEIAGKAVIRADCSNAASLAEAITRVLTDEVLREHLIQLGREQVRPFTIEACAEATLKTYQKAVGIDEPQQPITPEIHPRVSVIVPAWRIEQASEALESLGHQNYRGEIETIVVGEKVDELAKRWPVITLNCGSMRGPAKARNLGASHATGEVLLFLDDDCVATEDWIEQNVRMLQQPKIGAVGGSLRGKSSSFFARCTDYTNFGEFQQGRIMDMPLAAGSMGITRNVFLAVGGFNEARNYGGEEDTDLCYRLQKQGYRTVYQPTIKVIHNHHRDTLGKLVRHNYTYGRSSGLLTKIAHRDMGLKNRLLYNVRFPPLFLLVLPLLAALTTMRIVAMSIRENPNVVLYAPVIFLAKLAYQFGVFRWLTLPKTEGLLSKSLPT